MKEFTVADLFCGVGGLSYGFSHNKAFKTVFANEYEKDIAKAYSLNYPTVPMLLCDIRELTTQKIKEAVRGSVDIVIGGPPCQSYSTLGKRRNDDRAKLFIEYGRIIEVLQPKIFIFENVVGILTMNGGRLFQEIQHVFEKIGYSLRYEILNAVEFGVPQIRERVFLVGTKGENSFEFPKPTHGGSPLKPFVTLEDAFSDLPSLKSGETSAVYQSEPQNEFQKFVRDSRELKDNDCPRNGEHLIRIMQALPDGGSKNDLPIELRPKSGYGNTYAKLWWRKPSLTVTRNFSCVSSSRCIHPRDSRALTTREGARLQSFPDSYLFYGSKAMKNLEIGNAVPPLLSVQIAAAVLNYLEEMSNVK